MTEPTIPTLGEWAGGLPAIEWGSRLAEINSQYGAVVTEEAPMPKWGWGIPGGPFLG